jgi:hypothetical protein
LHDASTSNEGLALILGLDRDAGGLIDGIDRLITKLNDGTLSEADITSFFELVVTMPVAEAQMKTEPVINVLQVKWPTFRSECKRLDNAFDDALDEADGDDESKISQLRDIFLEALDDAKDKFRVDYIADSLAVAAGPKASFCHIII